MTKLNITNKRLYKLKKHKNQSKKNMPKKRKNRKRRNRRGGRSFRKRRKYNIKNNSIKKYLKQKGGTKVEGGQEAIIAIAKMKEHVEKSKYKAAMITSITDENGVQKFIILPEVKYVTTKPTGESLAPYAKTSPTINDNEPQFQNYYLNNNITASNGNEKSLLDMIAERLERHIFQIIETEGPNKIYETEQLKLDALKAIPAKMNDLFITPENPKLRNIFKEKVNALTFLHWIIDITKNYDDVDYENDIKATINDETLNTLFYLYVDGYNPNANLLSLEGSIKSPFKFPTDDTKIRNAFNMVNVSQGLIECSPLLESEENLSDKLSLAMTQLIANFEHTWSPEDVEGLNDNKETDGKMTEFAEQEEQLREITIKKNEDLSKFIETIKVDEIQVKIDQLKRHHEVINIRIADKKTEVAAANVAKTAAEQKAADEASAKKQKEVNDKQQEIEAQKAELEGKQNELDEANVKVTELEKSLNDCRADDTQKKTELEGKLAAAKAALDATKAELETQKTKTSVLEDQQKNLQTQLDESKLIAATAAKKSEQATDDLDTAKNPTEIPEEPLIGRVVEDGKEDLDAEEEDFGAEEEMGKLFDDGPSDEPKGVIKAPMSADGEVIVYLKRRWDGKFIVSTLGTGGDDGDAANVWISNIGHAPETQTDGDITEEAPVEAPVEA